MDYGAALEMRFGATRRGFESRPLRHPVLGWSAYALLTAIAVIVSGCDATTATGTRASVIADKDWAVARAKGVTVLQEPITVIRVEQGRAGDMVRTPVGLYPNAEEAARDQAKRQRTAWAVTLVGLYPDSCDVEPCPLVETQHQIAFDVETGEILLQVIGGDLDR